MCHQSHGNEMPVWHTMFTLARLLTFNLSLDFSVAMVPVVDLLLCSLASSHRILVISNIVNCYGRWQPT